MNSKEKEKTPKKEAENKRPPAREELQKLRSSLRKKEIMPRFIFAAGEERFFIDQVDKLLAESYIQKEDWDFNRSIYYANAMTIEEFILSTQNSSLLGGRRLIILREAHTMDNLDKILDYADEIAPETTILICYPSSLKSKEGILERFEAAGAKIIYSPPLRTRQSVSALITFLSRELNIVVAPDASDLLFELVGDNATNMYTELSKLSILAGVIPNRLVSRRLVAACVTKSRELTVFNLIDALINKNHQLSFEIALVMINNKKKYPLPTILSTLFTFFSNLLIVLYQPMTLNAEGIASLLRIKNSYASKNYLLARGKYNAKHTYNILHEIRMAEARSKGADGGGDSNKGILLDLITYILG